MEYNHSFALPPEAESFILERLARCAHQQNTFTHDYERRREAAEKARNLLEEALGDQIDLLEAYDVACADLNACSDTAKYLQGFRDCLRLYKTLEL